MRYQGTVYRPPSEARSFLLQATIGCSWNHCTYCNMYRDKQYKERALADILEDIDLGLGYFGPGVSKVFIMDGDALGMPMDLWIPILEKLKSVFPGLRQVSCYATAINLLDKTKEELNTLKSLGLSMLYIGPESGDNVTLKSLAKGSTFEDHAKAAQKAKAAGMKQSVIFLLGVGGTTRSAEHAAASGQLASAMDPEFLSCLTLTLVEGTPIYKQAQNGTFTLPGVDGFLEELKIFIEHTQVTGSVFRANHASNYLPIGGRLPKEKEAILETIKAAQQGQVALKPEMFRGL